jgi:hypothetical protein
MPYLTVFLIKHLKMTIDSQPDSKKRERSRKSPIEKTKEQIEREKADRLEKKQELARGIEVYIERINILIEECAEELGLNFEDACNKLHLGGRVYKDRRSVNSYNVWLFCSARVDDERCLSSNIYLTSNRLLVLSGKSSDADPRHAQAISVVKHIQDTKGTHKDLTEEEGDLLNSLLEADRIAKDTGIVGKPMLQLHDVRTTMDKVGTEVSVLSLTDLNCILIFHGR